MTSESDERCCGDLERRYFRASSRARATTTTRSRELATSNRDDDRYNCHGERSVTKLDRGGNSGGKGRGKNKGAPDVTYSVP